MVTRCFDWLPRFRLCAIVDGYDQQLEMQFTDPNGQILASQRIKCFNTVTNMEADGRQLIAGALHPPTDGLEQVIEIDDYAFSAISWTEGIALAGEDGLHMLADTTASRPDIPLVTSLWNFVIKHDGQFIDRFFDRVEDTCIYDGKLHQPCVISNLTGVAKLYPQKVIKQFDRFNLLPGDFDDESAHNLWANVHHDDFQKLYNLIRKRCTVDNKIDTMCIGNQLTGFSSVNYLLPELQEDGVTPLNTTPYLGEQLLRSTGRDRHLAVWNEFLQMCIKDDHIDQACFNNHITIFPAMLAHTELIKLNISPEIITDKYYQQEIWSLYSGDQLLLHLLNRQKDFVDPNNGFQKELFINQFEPIIRDLFQKQHVRLNAMNYLTPLGITPFDLPDALFGRFNIGLNAPDRRKNWKTLRTFCQNDPKCMIAKITDFLQNNRSNSIISDLANVLPSLKLSPYDFPDLLQKKLWEQTTATIADHYISLFKQQARVERDIDTSKLRSLITPLINTVPGKMARELSNLSLSVLDFPPELQPKLWRHTPTTDVEKYVETFWNECGGDATRDIACYYAKLDPMIKGNPNNVKYLTTRNILPIDLPSDYQESLWTALNSQVIEESSTIALGTAINQRCEFDNDPKSCRIELASPFFKSRLRNLSFDFYTMLDTIDAVPSDLPFYDIRSLRNNVKDLNAQIGVIWGRMPNQTMTQHMVDRSLRSPQHTARLSSGQIRTLGNLENPNLKSLILENTNIRDLDPDMLHKYPNLEALRILTNLNFMLKPGIQLPLKEFDFEFTNYGYQNPQDSTIFAHFPAIEKLRVKNIQFKDTIDLSHLTQLQKLDLTDIKKDVTGLDKLAKLKDVTLVNNNLIDFPHLPSTVRSINISQNQITYVPDNITEFTDLEDLILIDNQITQLPADIGKLKRTRLWLSNNPITTLKGLSREQYRGLQIDPATTAIDPAAFDIINNCTRRGWTDPQQCDHAYTYFENS